MAYHSNIDRRGIITKWVDKKSLNTKIAWSRSPVWEKLYPGLIVVRDESVHWACDCPMFILAFWTSWLVRLFSLLARSISLFEFKYFSFSFILRSSLSALERIFHFSCRSLRGFFPALEIIILSLRSVRSIIILLQLNFCVDFFFLYFLFFYF